MTQYEMDLRNLKSFYHTVDEPFKVHQWSNLKRSFISKYVVLFSPTDKTFNKVQSELRMMESNLMKKYQQGFLFDWNRSSIF